MGGGKGGGDAGDSTTTVRFAPYIESHHEQYLNTAHWWMDYYLTSLPNQRSPFANFIAWDIDDAFFGVGYVMSSFPSLYDMYGKFMAGLDIDMLFNQIFIDSTTGPIIDNLVSAQAENLSDDLENVATPRFVTGMRDINSVLSSTFVVGRAMMETARQKDVSHFDAELRYKMMPVAVEHWKTHLEWNRDVIRMYADILKLYISGKMDVDNHTMEMATKNALWPFQILQYFGTALGALTGAKTTTEDVQGASKTQKTIGGAMAGTAAGFAVGGPWGAAIGGVLGAAGGMLS